MPLVMLLMLAFPSCAIIEINGLGNDYKDLTESQKALVRPLEIEYGRLTKVLEKLYTITENRKLD